MSAEGARGGPLQVGSGAQGGPLQVGSGAQGGPLQVGSGALVGPLEIGPVAHGGDCVARADGRVIFVRHTAPGEQVMVRITDDSKKSFWRGDAVEILRASPDRVTPPCPVAAECGGCDFQHLSLPAQRDLKTAVVREQVQRLAGLDWDGEVEEVPGSPDGLHWRTRMRYAIDAGGTVGLRAHRSRRIVPLPGDGCPLSVGATMSDLVTWSRGGRELVVAAGHETSAVADGRVVTGPAVVRHRVLGHDFEVPPDGFWQVHPSAPEVLTSAVLEALEPAAGERALDLYCGVGLFAKALDAAGARVVGVEGERRAVQFARRNVPGARFLAAPVEKSFTQIGSQFDLVVLDPPRAGAGRGVISAICGTHPRAIALVACDPASLGRDLRLFGDQGYRLAGLRGFDLFPMTHHVECVATLVSA